MELQQDKGEVLVGGNTQRREDAATPGVIVYKKQFVETHPPDLNLLSDRLQPRSLVSISRLVWIALASQESGDW